MDAFGDLLKRHRSQAIDPETGRRLSQMRLADLLAEVTGMPGVSGASISYWESGKYRISKDDRVTLVGLIQVLCQCGGLMSLVDATTLLHAGNYRALSQVEIRQVNPLWDVTAPTDQPTQPDLPSAEAQVAALPPPSYIRLFGLEDKIDAICQQLRANTMPWIMTLVGLGGVGKTSLADAVARRFIQESHFERVIWVSAQMTHKPESPAMFEAIMLALGEQLLPQILDRTVPDRRHFQIRQVLKQRHYLIVIDNLEQADETAYLLAQLNQFTQPSKFLLTTRYLPPVEANVYVVQMGEMSQKDAIDFIRYQAQINGIASLTTQTDEALVRLYQVAGGHPLSLRLIVRLARFHTLSHIQRRLQSDRGGRVADMYQHIYGELWAALDPAEKQLLQAMPLVAPSGGTAAHLQAISLLTEDAFWPALENLIEQSLLEPRAPIKGEPRYGIHRLTEQFLANQRQNLTTEQVQAQFRSSTVANLQYWEAHIARFSEWDWAGLDLERHHVFRAILFSLGLPPPYVTSALRETWLSLARQLYNFGERRGYWHEWLPLLDQLIPKFADDPAAQNLLLSQLGDLYRLTQQLPQAIKAHQQAEQLANQLGDEQRVGQIALTLGVDYLRAREYDEAIRYGQKALQTFDRLHITGREVGAAHNLLGLVFRALGRWEEAAEHLQEAIAIWREAGSVIELARSLNNLALVYEAQNNIQSALTCYQEARQILTETPDALDWTLIAISEGNLYYNLGRFPEAAAAFNRIDLDFLRQSGHQRYEALTLNNLGCVALEQGQYEQAEAHVRDSISLWRQLNDPVRLADTLDTLTETLIRQKRYAAAQSACEEAIDLLAGLPEDYHVKQLRSQLSRRRQKLQSSFTSSTEIQSFSG